MTEKEIPFMKSEDGDLIYLPVSKKLNRLVVSERGMGMSHIALAVARYMEFIKKDRKLYKQVHNHKEIQG